MLAQIEDRHISALPGKENGYGSTDPRVTARDHGDHILQLSGALVSRRQIARPRIEILLEPGFLLMLFREGRLGLHARTGLYSILLTLPFPALPTRGRIDPIHPCLDLPLLLGFLLSRGAV